jgi:2-(1,2-epoxy-1,2-dihydrophenyl)acetyl-CoA isomerase
MNSQRLRVEIEGGVGRVTLARPDAANAIDLGFAQEFEAAALACREQNVRVVLIAAEGRFFCAGGDLKSFSAQPDLPSHLAEVTRHLHSGIATFVELDAPVVLAITGAAAGAGIGLVGAADVVVAGKSATFVMAYTAIGLSPDGSSSWFLARHLGVRRALDLTLTNRVLSASEALDWGLVSRVVGDAQVEAEAEGLVEKFSIGPTGAYGASARLIRSAGDRTLREHMAAESESIVNLSRSANGIEGIASFVERRSPHFGE